MTEIPDDIMKAAQGSVDRMPDLGSPMEPGEFWARVEYEVVSAILAERQRCAAFAYDKHDWPPRWIAASLRGESGGFNEWLEQFGASPSPKPEAVSEGGEDE